MIDLTSIQAGDPKNSSFKRSGTRPPFNRASSARCSYFGRPGSKRFQRYVNKSFLLENEDELRMEDLIVFQAPTITPLSLLFEERNKKIWEPFVSVTEEQQKNMIAIVEMSSSRHTAADVTLSSPQSFDLIDMKIRKILKNNSESEFFSDLEKELLHYIESDEIDSLAYSFEETYHRMICHGISQYYNLESRSKNENGNRIVVVQKKKDSRVPGETLSQFLQRNIWNV